MTDMLVKLYELPALELSTLKPIDIRRAIAPEKHDVIEWVGEHFSKGWASECDVSFSNHAPTCFIAVEEGELLGFACYDATMKGFFGPTGVAESARGRGVGKALLLACLHDMFAHGYGYGIIGGVGPVEFYQKVVGATVIEGSTPGIYRGLLQKRR